MALRPSAAAQSTASETLEDLLYARGFTLARSPGRTPHEHWPRRELGGWTLAHDPRVPFTQASAGDATVSVLGLAIDTRAWNSQEAATREAAEALAHGEEGLLELIDSWAGRHLIVWSANGETNVITDATGVRTCFYNLAGELVLSSHAPLAAELTDAAPAVTEFTRDRRWRRGVRFFPGRSTPWEGIVFLTPNMVLELESRGLRRVWPRRPLPRRSVDEAVDCLHETLPGQMRWLADLERPIVVSISGGLDSRITLAASRSVADQLTYFTYDWPKHPDYASDMEIAKRIATALGLNHIPLVVPEKLGQEGKLVRQAARANTFLRHFRPGVVIYRSTFASESLHVRSNISGIGADPFQKHKLGREVNTPSDLARTWKNMEDVPDCVDAFEEWADAVRFWDVGEVEGLDLFFLEHRLPCWHGCLVLESDLAFDTHVIFNCRRVIENFLSVPLEARASRQVALDYVAKAWPEAAPFPIV